MKSIAAIIFTFIGIFGSVKLKSSNIISSDHSLVILLFGSVLVGLFIAYSDKIKELNFSQGKMTLQEMKQTEVSIKEVGKAILDVIDKNSGFIANEDFDQQALDDAKARLKRLIS